MWTLLFAILGAVLLGASFEGTIRLPGILASCTVAKLGRVRLGLYVYRPGRAYAMIGVAGR